METELNMDEVVSKITESVTQNIGESNEEFERRIEQKIEARLNPKKEEPLEFNSDEDIYKSSTKYTDDRVGRLEQSQAVTDAIIAVDQIIPNLGFSGEIAPYAKEIAKSRLIEVARSNPGLVQAMLAGDKQAELVKNDLVDIATANAQRKHQQVIQDAAHGEHKEMSEKQSLEDFKKFYKETMGRDVDDERAKRLMEMN